MDPVSFLFKCATHAAGNRLREIQQNKEREEAERLAAQETARRQQVALQEKAREDRDPVYRAARDAQRTEEAVRQAEAVVLREEESVAWTNERQLRAVQRVMFWLSFACFISLCCCSSSDGNATAASNTFLWAWLGFGLVWLYLCFVPKRFS